MPDSSDRTAAGGGPDGGERIVVTLDVMLARRKLKSKDLARAIGITEANLSLLKQGKVKGIRFETLAALCEVLECQPGDLLAFEPVPARRGLAPCAQVR